MSHLFMVKEPVLIALTAIFYIIAFVQTAYAIMVALRGKDSRPKGALLYEILLIAYAVIACDAANAAHSNYGAFLFRIKILSIPIEYLLWINLVTFCLGLFLAIKHRKPIMSIELAVLLASTPPVIYLSDGFSWILLCACACCLLFRVSSAVCIELMRHKTTLTMLSVGEAIKNLRGGILYYNRHGRVLLMNDSMQDYLYTLEIGGHLFGVANVWKTLENLSSQSGLNRELKLNDENRVLVEVGEGSYKLFQKRTVVLNDEVTEQIVAVDVTEGVLLNRQMQQSNAELMAANEKLKLELSKLENEAKSEAVAGMHRRVHNNIGQRMSIIHQFLESGNEDPDALRQVIDLACGISTCLSTFDDNPDELASLQEAFHLVGLSLEIEGEVSLDATLRDSLVSIIREASTNALKHGEAKNVWVTISENDDGFRIKIKNDGKGANPPLREGCGLTYMRKLVEGIGGSFNVSSLTPFIIEIEVRNKEAAHDTNCSS